MDASEPCTWSERGAGRWATRPALAESRYTADALPVTNALNDASREIGEKEVRGEAPHEPRFHSRIYPTPPAWFCPKWHSWEGTLEWLEVTRTFKEIEQTPA